MKLLLIDDRIDQLETFVQGVNETTEVILYSFENDTYEDIASRKKYEDYEAVGIVSHNYNDPIFQLLMKEKIATFFDMNTWTPFINFLKQFKTPIVDLMACKLFSEKNWQDVFTHIEETTKINIRGSTDDTGNPEQGGNWIMESDNIDVRELYFTDKIESYTGILGASYNRYYGDYNTRYEDEDFIVTSTQYGYAILVKSLGRVWNAGYSNLQNGVWVLGTDNQILTNITSIYSNIASFCAIDDSGYVYAWGFNGNGAFETGYAERVKDSDGIPISNIISITSNVRAFAALSSNGYVYTWGPIISGGINPSYAVQLLLNGTSILSGIVKIYGVQSFFFAIDTLGYLYKWGQSPTTVSYAIQINIGSISGPPVVLLADKITTINNGLSGIDSDGYVYTVSVIPFSSDYATAVRIQNGSTGPFLGPVVSISATESAFATIDILKNVYAWGAGTGGGINTVGFATQVRTENGSTGPFLEDVVSISSTQSAFAVITGSTGNVYAWGSTVTGGVLNPSYATQVRTENGSTGPFLENVVSISSTQASFATLNGSGDVYTWGNSLYGGINTNFATQITVGSTGPPLSDIVSITPNHRAFAALDDTNSLYTWGSEIYGGGQLNYATIVPYPNPIKAVINSSSAFLLLDEFKNFAIFGSSTNGGRDLTNLVDLNVVEKKVDTEPVLNLSTNNNSSFILRTDNSNFIIGTSFSGGLNNSYASKILDNNNQVVSNNYINGVIVNGNVYVWGVYLNLSVPTLVTLENGTPISDIITIKTSERSFTFIDSTGSVYSIGDPLQGGISSTFATKVTVGSTGGAYLDNITSVTSNIIGRAFAALGDTGHVYAWGDTNSGGINTSYATHVRTENGSTGPFLEDIVSINSNLNNFTAIGSTGNVYSWGNTSTGGINTTYATQVRIGNASTGPFLEDVVSVTSNNNAVAAIVGSTGNVYTWGSAGSGGINTLYATHVRTENGSTGPFLEGVVSVKSNNAAFAAIVGSTGNVYSWGNIGSGGIDGLFATQVNFSSFGPPLPLSNIISISSFINGFGFAALDGSGNVYAWGSSGNGGINPMSATQVRVGNGSTGPFLTNVVTIANNQTSFAAIDDNGYVYAWGNVNNGGIVNNFATQLRINDPINGEFLVAGLENKIVSNSTGYAVLANDGQVYSWGNFTSSVGPSLNFASKINKFSFEPYINPSTDKSTLDVVYKDYEFTVNQIMEKAVVNEETKGIAVTSAPATNGLWKYKTDSFWQDVPDVSETSSLPLLAASSLQFVPSGSYNGSAEFSFKPWSGLIVEETELFDSSIPNLGVVSQNKVDVTVNDEAKPEPEEKAGAMSTILIIFGILIVIAVIFIFFAPTIIGFFSNIFSDLFGKGV